MITKKVAILTAIYTFLCFVIAFIFAFTVSEIPVLLEIDIGSYKVLTGLNLFIQWLPSIFASIFFVTLATYLDKDGQRNLQSFSTVQMDSFRRIMIVICANVIILFCAAEIFQPLINASKVEKEVRITDYEWYIKKSIEFYEQDDILGAIFYADTALELYPTSQDALDLKELLERTPAENVTEALQYFPEVLQPSETTETSSAETVLKMLENARESFDNQNYFDAHYYAFVGLELGGTNNANSAELQKISLDAWSKLSTWSGFETDEDMRIFEQKRQGYSYLMERDSLSAYYVFLDLHNKIPHDRDVIRYFALAENALLNEYFFIDETTNLTHFEKSKNIHFSVTRNDGLHYEVSIGGITNVRSAGKFLKYLRNYSCTVQDSTGTILYSFTVPYVKLIGQPLSSFHEETMIKLDLEEKDLVPRLLLTSVDRTTKGVVSSPIFTHGKANALDDSLTFLPMSLDDFDLIADASAGPMFINLASLYSFIPKAEEYGFSTLVFSSYFLQRACYPFLIFALFLYLAIQAWNFRLPENSLFRFYWVLMVPFFTIIAESIRALLDYGMSLLSLTFARLEGIWQIPLFIFAFIIIIIIEAIRFLSLHTEQKKK